MVRAFGTSSSLLILGLLLSVYVNRAQAQCSVLGDPSAVTSDMRAWRGSAFDFGQSLGASTLSKSSTLSYDPYYAWTFDACLQWYVGPAMKVSVEQALDVELTDSNTTISRQRPLLSDTSLRIDGVLWNHHFNASRRFALNGGVEVLAPTSIASRASSMVVGTRLRFGPKWVWKDLLAGSLLVLEASYLRRFSHDTTTLAETPYPCFGGTDAAAECTHLPGSTNLRDVLTLKLLGAVEFTQRLGTEFVFALEWAQANALGPANLTTDTGATITLPDQSPTHWRNSRKLVIGVYYSFASFLDIELSSTTRFAERSQDGTLRGPFHVSDTLLGLDARIELEKLFSAVKGDAVLPSGEELR